VNAHLSFGTGPWPDGLTITLHFSLLGLNKEDYVSCYDAELGSEKS